MRSGGDVGLEPGSKISAAHGKPSTRAAGVNQAIMRIVLGVWILQMQLVALWRVSLVSGNGFRLNCESGMRYQSCPLHCSRDSTEVNENTSSEESPQGFLFDANQRFPRHGSLLPLTALSSSISPPACMYVQAGSPPKTCPNKHLTTFTLDNAL